MRAPVVFLTTIFTVLVTSTNGWAQSGDRKDGDEKFVPYHTHRDSRFGHAHSYPDRGAIIRDVPKTAMVVSYAGISYRFDDGVWFEPRGPAFMVTAPPIGLIVSSLPPFSTVLARGGRTFLYSNDTFYMPRPDVGGYEVVNDPDDGGAIGTAASPAPPPPSPSWDGSSLKAMDAPAAVATTALPPNAASATAAVPAVAATPAASNSTLAVATQAPVAAANAAAADAEQSSKALIYPKNGQSADQQARDRYECYRFGVAQSGFDPMHPVAGSGTTSRAGGAADFERAQGVCLDAHGYAVR